MKGRCLAAATHSGNSSGSLRLFFLARFRANACFTRRFSPGPIPASAERRRSLCFLSGLQANYEMVQRLNPSASLPQAAVPKGSLPHFGSLGTAILCQPQTSANDYFRPEPLMSLEELLFRFAPTTGRAPR